MASEAQDEDVKTESSWAGPARILFITLILAVGFVYYYFGPSVDELQGNSPKASISKEPVTVSVADETFTIPQNYTQFVKTRRGGVQDTVDLYAILPDLEGFTIAHQDSFEGNAENSPIIHISLQDLHAPDRRFGEEKLTHRMTEREKFERIYLPLAVDPKGESARYGFTRYRLSASWGGQDEDLFVHEASDGGVVLYRCLEAVPSMPSPWCRRDLMLTDRLTLNYRFKRQRLSDWRDIDEKVMKLVESFRRVAPQPASSQTAPAPGDASPAMPPSAPPAFEDAPTPTSDSGFSPQSQAPQLPSAPDLGAAPLSGATPPALEPRTHRIDPNADPEPDEDAGPGGESGTPKAPRPEVPPN
jgi:hypothetical protein